MQIYFGMDNSRPANLGDLASLLSARDQQTVSDAIQVCCPPQAHEPGIHRILSGDAERLRAYVGKHGQRLNPAQRGFIDAGIKGRTFHR